MRFEIAVLELRRLKVHAQSNRIQVWAEQKLSSLHGFE